MPKCCVPGCRNRTGHIFPRSERVRKQWVLATRRENWKPSANSILCSRHFLPTCYMSEGYHSGMLLTRKQLKKDAVPTVFEWRQQTTTSSSKKARKERTVNLNSMHDCTETESRVNIKEEPPWDGSDSELQPPLEVYVKTEFSDDPDSEELVIDESNCLEGSECSSPQREAEFENVDVSKAQPAVPVRSPDVDPLQFTNAPTYGVGQEYKSRMDGEGRGYVEQRPAEEPQVRELAYACVGCPMSYSTLKYLKTHEYYCRKLKVPKHRKRKVRVQPGLRVDGESISTNVKTEPGVKVVDAGPSTKSKRFACEVCGLTMSTNSNYKQHMLLHSGVKPFTCPQCQAGFARKADLKRHILLHIGEKPYACDLCGLRFTQSAHLTQHRMVHTGLRPFVCGVCSESFAKKGNLKKHIWQHQGARPYSCDVCGVKFSQSAHLNVHTRRVHQNQVAMKE